MVSMSIVVILSLFALKSQATAIKELTEQDFLDLYFGCVCRFDASGYCKIHVEARRNTKACICHGHEYWYDDTSSRYARCKGEEVDCANPESPHCKNPDTSYLSCLQGKGECNGYTHSNDWQQGGCKCSYSTGGCHVTHRAPDNYACRCHWMGAWTCRGQVELCGDFNHPKCRNPDLSLESCKLGQGTGWGRGDCSANLYKKKVSPLQFGNKYN